GRFAYPGVGFRVDRVLINITEEDCHPLPYNNTHFDFLSNNNRPAPSALPRRTSERLRLFPPQYSSGSSLPPLPKLSRGSYRHENPFCSENVDVTNFLNLNSYANHDDFCLAYVFTYRDFAGGTLGLAWVAELGGSGGVCEKHRLMREGSHTVKKSLNTGVVTLLNYGSRVSMKISQLTFAHEMGHNLGAKHDDDFKDETPACLPSVDDPKGNYIMFASATGGDKENNNKFSLCSVNSIARLLHQVLKNHTRVCKGGECLGSVCERIPGWTECSLSRGEDITPEMMCYVACRNIRNDTPCISTIQLETDENLRKAYPRLAAELLQQPGGRAVRLQPGTPCDNYRGYCDVFFVCRSVEVEGPLARLHKLLFSPQMLSKVKTWITVSEFRQTAYYSTPSSRTYHPQSTRGHPVPFIPPPPLQHSNSSASAAHSPPLSPIEPNSSANNYQKGQRRRFPPQGNLPREQFAPPFRLKRRRTIDPINGVERQVSELIPASSVPVPYHRSRGGGGGGSGGRGLARPPSSNSSKAQPKVTARPVSVVVYQEPVLPSHVRDLPSGHPPSQPSTSSQDRRQTSSSASNPLSGNKQIHKQRPMSFVVLGTAVPSGGSHDNENLLLLMPPINDSPPPAYSPRSHKNVDNQADHNVNT
ncbi:unnamed protein product, partial [Rodentolepis nana]|uniref:Peptidase M12B domain-containing protein n=1 Tax=Rodentolepis nana TaxID=102285 RepID=A0A158QIE5_RODNA